MRGILAACAVALGCSIAGCASTSDEDRPEPTEEEAPEASQEQKQPPPVPYDDGEPKSDDPCAGGGEVYVIDGLEIFVPAACNPNWFDTGDPPELGDGVENTGQPC